MSKYKPKVGFWEDQDRKLQKGTVGKEGKKGEKQRKWCVS